MDQDATVNAGDIARLVDVGRAAVSNWRRRHDDFPQPVGGTASSPLFSLREVEEWLRRNGKRFQVSLADRTWQRLRAAGDDLHLADRVVAAGVLLLAARDDVAGGGGAGGRAGEKGEPTDDRAAASSGVVAAENAGAGSRGVRQAVDGGDPAAGDGADSAAGDGADSVARDGGDPAVRPPDTPSPPADTARRSSDTPSLPADSARRLPDTPSSLADPAVRPQAVPSPPADAAARPPAVPSRSADPAGWLPDTPSPLADPAVRVPAVSTPADPARQSPAMLSPLADPALRPPAVPSLVGDPASRLPTMPSPLADPDLVGLVRELGAEMGARDAFEFLFNRYLEAHSRRVSTTSPDVAALMTILTVPPHGTVLDPSCGFGTILLTAPHNTTLIGQDLDPTTAAIAAIRLALARPTATTATTAGDSLRDGTRPTEPADAVVCDPPFNERAWGYQDLTSDPRWEYGLPPRGESELAWLQHCLAHVRPGGKVAILMPAAVAGRRPGRRIRGNLLRKGALRAVISLSPTGPDLWLLRRPEPGERPPSHLLLLKAHETLRGVEPAWLRHLADPSGSTRIIDLLDDDVDVSPLRHQKDDDREETVRELRAATWWLGKTGIAPPELKVLDQQRPLQFTTVGELVKAGALTVRQAPARMPTGVGEVPVLTADDLARHGPPSGWTDEDDSLVELRPGDVVASVLGGATRVITTEEAVLGPYLTRYRADPDLLDPDFLAGVIRAAEPVTHGGSSRTDVRRVRIPRLPLAEQRDYGTAFRRLVDLEDTLRTAASAGETLVRLGFACLAAGHAVPSARQDREG